jgi:hypothetical protein
MHRIAQLHNTHPNEYIVDYRDGQSDGVDDAAIRYRQGVGFRRVDLQLVISIRLSWHCTLILPKVDF